MIDPGLLAVKVYLEDTDAQGVVYHANYLKYFERGRSELIARLGGSVRDVGQGATRFVVHEMQLKFLRPAFLGDELTVRTEVRKESDFRVCFLQRLLRGDDSQPLVKAEAQVVCLDREGALAELPAFVTRAFPPGT